MDDIVKGVWAETRAHLVAGTYAPPLTPQQLEAVLKHYGACVICNGEGVVHRDGRHSQIGHKICVACQGQRVHNGWSNQWFKELAALRATLPDKASQ